MALYAIGDFHLDFSTDKPMEIFDPVWKNHHKKIKKHWNKIVKPTDTVVITGGLFTLSWKDLTTVLRDMWMEFSTSWCRETI